MLFSFDLIEQMYYNILYMELEKTICFTGHRNSHLPWRGYEIGEQFNNFRIRLRNAIEENIKKGYVYFLSGMAIGTDMIFSELVLDLRKKYDIKLICVLPFKNPDNIWAGHLKERFRNILENADDVIITSETYSKSSFMIRNKYMVNNSNKLIACFGNFPGGTLNTINYAKSLGKEIEFVILY